jgi:CubicO group peptidase (beta-lactamase class C family)
MYKSGIDITKVLLLTFTTWLCLILEAIIPFNAFAQASGNETNFDAIDAYITTKMKGPRIPGLALAIVKGDQVIYLAGYGQADLSGRPITPQTPFIIGSVTKSFTALAVMQLVEAGKVELDAPVQHYIPWFRTTDIQASAKITVRQLLNQTSGLPMIREPQLWTEQDEKALERTVRLLPSAKLQFPPGRSFGYSNSNYEALGLIVQDISGMSYEQYIKQYIFAPLDMQNSFASQEEALQHGMATGYRWWFGIPVPVTLHYNRSELPAGYLISSAEDMAHFLIAQMNGGHYRDTSVLSPAGIALTHAEPVPNTYGMGWETISINGNTLINHDGGTANFESSVFFDPEKKVGVFIAANVMCALDAFSSPHGSDPLDGATVRAMAHTVLSMVTKRPVPDQGIGIRKLYIIFDITVFLLTLLLIVSLAMMPAKFRRLKRYGIATKQGFIRRSSIVALLHFVWPLVILYLALNVPFWKILFVMFQPDLGYWLQAVAVIVFIKGLVEIVMRWRVYRQAQYQHPV